VCHFQADFLPPYFCLRQPGGTLARFSVLSWIEDLPSQAIAALQFHIAFLLRSLRWLRFFLKPPTRKTVAPARAGEGN
jgi:hypothetical protein